MKVTNSSKSTIIATQANLADTFITRLVGLLNRDHLAPQEGLIITKCNSIHMFFMKFAIDVIFVSKTNQVVGLVENIKPYQLSQVFWKSSFCIELPVGAIKSSKTQVGDIISLQE